jgi:hypothetical protein
MYVGRITRAPMRPAFSDAAGVHQRRTGDPDGSIYASQTRETREKGRNDVGRWGSGFDPDRLATLETRMWKAYYRRQPARLFGWLLLGLREQARVSWPRALVASLWLTKAAAGFSRADAGYDRFAPDIARGYRLLGLPDDVDALEVARRELRWWVVRREIGLSAGTAAGDAITSLYAALYHLSEGDVAEAGRLRGQAAEVRDRGAAADPEGQTGVGRAYWPEVARLLGASYRSLKTAVSDRPAGDR